MCALCLPRATASRASLGAPLRRARQESRRVGSREVLSFRLSAAILAKAASGRRRSVSRVPRHFFGREASKEEDEEQPAVPAHCVRLVNNTETQLDVLAFPKDAMAFSFGGQVTKIPPLSHLDVTAKSRTCRLAIRRRDSAQMVVLPRGATLTLQQRQEEDSDSYHEAVLGDIAATFDAGTSWEILPGPLFWRLSRNVQDVEFQVAALLHAANARLSFKVVRELGSDWRSRPTARIRVVGAGFLGSNFLHKGTMYIAKITAPSAVEEITAAHRRISGTFGPPEQVLRFEGYVKTDTGAHILLFEDFGESLATIMSSNSETLTVRDKDQCAQDLMAALTALHSSGVYHLALSPESVRLRRDGMGTMRLKLADLGTAERASEPLPSSKPTLLGWQSYMAPEVRSRKGMQKLLARMASEPKKKAPKVPDSKLLGSVKNLEILPSLRKHRSKPPGGVKTGMDSQTQMKLLAEFPIFAELSPADLVQLAREFQGPFYVPAGATLFRANDMGDFLYFILAGEVVARRGKKELRRYTRGGFVGETALLGKRPTRRIFSAAAARGGGGCAVLRMHHTSFRKDFRSRGPVTGIVGPARWRFLEQPALGPDPEAVDSFSAGALWCQLAAGSKVISLSRIKRASTVEDLLAAVATRELGGFYFLLQEWRQVALIELMVRRASAYEALVCMEEQDKIVTEPAEDVEPPQGFLGSVGRTVTDIQKTALSAFELTQDAMAASVAVKMSNSARATVLNQWKKLTNVVTERYGQAVGEVFGTIYGNLFAKDLLWMFRNPTRAQRFPVLLVREAENGSLLARWQIGASMVFESELCARTLPRVLPSVKPAMQAGFQIGSAVGRNRAINFKRLWVDAFLGSFFKQLWTLLRLKVARVKGNRVKWDKLGNVLKESVIQGQTARNLVLTKFGRLPTKYDQNDPQVLQLLPSKWVPEIGLPLASGIGRGFMTKWWKGFRAGLRRKYVRPRFETWDLEDVPPAILDFARQQGAEQAALVASSVGDTMARDWGYWSGSFLGVVSGLMLCMIGRSTDLKDDTGMVADGYLESDRELLALQEYMQDSRDK